MKQTDRIHKTDHVLKHCLLFLALFLCNAAMLPAQQPLFVNYQKFDPENGLPQSYVTSIVQDSIGFMWISTLDGLVRYDGNSFQTLKQLSTDTAGLSSNRIHRMLLDKNGLLVIKYVIGPVDYLDPKTLRIKRNIEPDRIYRTDNMGPHWRSFEELMHDGNANWLHVSLNESFEIMDTTSNRLATYSSVLYEREKFDFYSFRITKEGMLYLLTPEGLKIYESPKSLPETVSLPVKVDLSASVRKRPVLFGKGDDEVLIGCKEGLLHFNNISKKFDLIPIDPGNRVNTLPPYLITEDPLGRPIFVFQRQVFRLEPNNEVSWLWQNPSSFDISALFVDRSNTLWIGMDADGLYKVNLESPGFASYSYSDNFVTDVLAREVKVSKDHLASLGYDRVTPYYFRYQYIDSETLVFGVENSRDTPGLFKLNAGSITPYYNPKFLPDAFTLSPSNDLYMLDSISSFFHFNPIDQSLTKINSNVPDSAHNITVALLADEEKYLWLGTSITGIFKVRNGDVLHHIRPNGKHSINTMRFDEREPDYLWIGTLGGGLLKWSKSQNKLLASYTTDSGLPNNTINCIVPDYLGNIWMSTNIGVSRFNPDEERFTNFTKADGLVETEFNRHHQMLLPDGRIAMGGTKGYSVFDPQTFIADTTNTQVILSSLSINDQPVLAGNHSPLSVAMLDEITLPYDSNTISFEFVPAQYNAPEKNQLRYQLDGFDKNWVEIGGERKFRFAQLPHGNYALKVVSTNTSGVWSKHVKVVDITILPPPWLTWWAYLSYTLLLLFIIRAIWQVYKNRLREKQEAEFNLREAARLREMDELKTRFFSNITHEFRTPLTLILSPLEKQLADPGISPSVKSLLDSNYRHARQLLNLVNQLLDISKIEGQQMMVSNSTGDLSQFLIACVDAFQEQASLKGIDLISDINTAEGYFLFDHSKWENIVYNLLSNAIKFSDPGKKHSRVVVTLGAAAQPDFVELQIEDTGVGIGPDQLEHIFERFYQVDDSSTRRHEGTGIGLALVKELVDLLDGSIKVESQVGERTTFTLMLPAQKLSEAAHQKLETAPPDREETSKTDTEADEETETPVLLVVEDNTELRSFIKEGLSRLGHVLEANDGRSARQLVINELPDIVISDVMMPRMNGFELCKLSKQDPRTAHINFILLTAKASQTAKIEGLESGADEYLTKPFNMQELELRVRNLLQEQRSLRKHLLDEIFPKSPESGVENFNDVFIKQLQKSLDRKLDDKALTADMLAQTVSMSKSTLNRKLKSVLNISTKDFIKQYRLKKATSLLLAGYPVNEVSYLTGFDTASYFGQCFKEQFHLTPTEFVKAHSQPKIETN